MVAVAWLTATVFFLITYWSPCLPLPPKEQLVYFEASGEDQDFYAGISGADSRGLRNFPQLWCVRLRSSACFHILGFLGFWAYSPWGRPTPQEAASLMAWLPLETSP